MNFNDFMKAFDTDVKKHKRNQKSQVMTSGKGFTEPNENLRIGKGNVKNSRNIS